MPKRNIINLFLDEYSQAMEIMFSADFYYL